MKNFMSSIMFRIFGNAKTTVGGGVFGVVLAAMFSKFEEMMGCKFSEAFANVDWGQLFVFGITQLFGALTTDANKTIDQK